MKKDAHRILMIAPYFPPRKRVGSQRPYRMAVRLKSLGWQPAIVTIESSSRLGEEEIALLEGIPILSLKTPLDRTTSGTNHRASNRIEETFSFIARWFPIDTWLPLLWLHRRSVIAYARQFNPDVVWSTADPWSSHWLGRTVAKALRVKWVADFRDPWMLCPVRNQRRSRLTQVYDRRIERRWINDADKIIFTSCVTEERYRLFYPASASRMSTIYNGFENMVYEEMTQRPHKSSANEIRIVFLGAFRWLSPAIPVIAMLKRLKEINDGINPSVKIISFAPLTDQDRILAESAGVLSHFEVHKPVYGNAMLDELLTYDILLVSASEMRNDIIPAKLWDYMPIGRPVLSLATNSEISHILHDTGIGIQLSPQDAADGLFQILQGAAIHQLLRFNPRIEQINKYSSENGASKLAEQLSTLCHLH